MEQLLELKINSILPGILYEDDACIQRLEKILQAHPRMQRAQLEDGDMGAKICLHFNPDVVTEEQVRIAAERAGERILNRYHHDILAIEGIDCSDCAIVIEHTLERLDGVLATRLNYTAKELWVEYDTHVINRRAIKQRIRSLGYGIPLSRPRKWMNENRELLLSLIAGFLLLVGWAGANYFALPQPISLIYHLAAYIIGGWNVTRHALCAFRERRFDIDSLMLVAALGAAVLGQFSEGALLLFLFSLGHSLEESALGRARAAVSALGGLTPKAALVRRGLEEVEISLSEIVLGDVVIVRSGARIPVDGKILLGTSGVDQSPITGESIPVDKSIDDDVYAGTINGEGVLEVKVSRLSVDSTLARVMRMVEEAQSQKSPTELAMQRFERVFVPVVLVADLLLITIPPLFGVPFRVSFLRGMTLLVAASPCALALGTPSAVLAGVAQAARNGVLVKGGAHLENLGRLKALAFDKTGTITHGRPAVTDIIALLPEIFSEEHVLGLSMSLENRSGHPLAQAIVRHAKKFHINSFRVDEVRSISGQGVMGVYDEQVLQVGSQAMVESGGFQISQKVLEQVENLEEEGKTVILLALDSQVIGILALADTLRSGVSEVVTRLSGLGVEKIAILSGDNRMAAEAIARQAGIPEVFAEMMPEQKAAAIQEMVQQYGIVAMVGDGVNDAPALAHATVGIAMGGAGTDVALETADVALLGSNLERLPFAIGLGRATRKVILQNLIIALSVIVLLTAASLTGWMGIGLAILLHEGSTIVVVLNALRLLGYRG
jgi:Zn2+/Cd2+-exporting ATPase